MSMMELFGKQVLVFDGAIGTQLQSMGLPAGLCPDIWCLDNPEAVRLVHQQYVAAGAQILQTNTTGASPLRLEHYGLRHKTRELNLAAVRLARETAGNQALVAGSVAALGTLIEPLGPISFDQAYEIFAEQVKALAEGAPDFIILETFIDLNELRAALLASKDFAPGIKIIAQISLDHSGRTITGTDPQSAGLVLQSLGADAIGFNCSSGPEVYLSAVAELAKVVGVPVSVQPNAGIPHLNSAGQTIFPLGPEDFASFGPKLVGAGAALVGGCCGTTPQHIRLLRNAVEGLIPGDGTGTCSGGTAGAGRAVTGLASRSQAVLFTEAAGPVIIGERINPTGRKQLAEDIRRGSFAVVRRDAKAQVAAGAQILDVNVGVPLIDEPAAMRGAVLAVQEAVVTPLCLDSADPKALAAGLKAFSGKALVNSYSLEPGKAEAVLPVAKRYGAAVIGLTIAEGGLPTTARERLEIAGRLVERAASYGIPRQDVIIDPLALAAGAQPEQVRETLQAIGLIKSELGCRTSLGISNISFGMPNRGFLNAAFLTMALAAGLDLAIINPLDERIMDTIRAAQVLLNQEGSARRYISIVGAKKLVHNAAVVTAAVPPSTSAVSAPIVTASKNTAAQDSVRRALYDAVMEGDQGGIIVIIDTALTQGIAPMAIVDGCLIPALDEVGRLYAQGIYFLPQLMQSASAMKSAMARLQPELKDVRAVDGQGTVVLATVQGDIHDIGKSIVALLLENHGFRVIDLGCDVSARDILAGARAHQADLVALSALMTTTMPYMKEVIDLFASEKYDCPVLIGGAATTGAFAQEIGAAGYGNDAHEAVREVRRLLSGNKNKGTS